MVERDKREGMQDGREWAEQHASYEDLYRLSEEGGDDLDVLRKAVDPNDELSSAEFGEYCFGDTVKKSGVLHEEYVSAWIAGAREFFNEVRDKL